MPVTYYQILGVPSDATPEQIKRGYRLRVKRYHPDVNPPDEDDQRANVIMHAINEAYDVLSDPVRRAEYDRSLALYGAGAARQAHTQTAGTSTSTPSTPRSTSSWSTSPGEEAFWERYYRRQQHTTEERIRQAQVRSLISLTLLLLAAMFACSFLLDPVLFGIVAGVLLGLALMAAGFWLWLKRRQP